VGRDCSYMGPMKGPSRGGGYLRDFWPRGETDLQGGNI